MAALNLNFAFGQEIPVHGSNTGVIFRPLNWTSTKVPLWQVDCEAFRRVGRPFELRDVTTQEHETFVNTFSARFNLNVKRKGTTVTFTPEISKAQ